jgi:hypothetical protein
MSPETLTGTVIVYCRLLLFFTLFHLLNDVNTVNRYSTETARNGAVFRSGVIRYVIWNDGLRP